MSRFSGPQRRGAMRLWREKLRQEAKNRAREYAKQKRETSDSETEGTELAAQV